MDVFLNPYYSGSRAPAPRPPSLFTCSPSPHLCSEQVPCILWLTPTLHSTTQTNCLVTSGTSTLHRVDLGVVLGKRQGARLPRIRPTDELPPTGLTPELASWPAQGCGPLAPARPAGTTSGSSKVWGPVPAEQGLDTSVEANGALEVRFPGAAHSTPCRHWRGKVSRSWRGRTVHPPALAHWPAFWGRKCIPPWKPHFLPPRNAQSTLTQNHPHHPTQQQHSRPNRAT